MLHTALPVLPGQTTTLAFAFKPSHYSSTHITSSLTFYMDQQTLPLKMKQKHFQQPRLYCPASPHDQVSLRLVVVLECLNKLSIGSSKYPLLAESARGTHTVLEFKS
ncbi:hypothetical protein Lal_00011680 [Lupinus albus]|nr:hypothetical protein Lal_00011680 [Lupinus albus]